MRDLILDIIDLFWKFIHSKVIVGKIYPVWPGNEIPELAWDRVKDSSNFFRKIPK